MQWTHLRLNGANEPLFRSPPARRTLFGGWRKAALALREGQSVLVHCAAGIHRAGVFGYGLLRLSCCAGLDRDAALVQLGALRQATRAGVADWRIALAEELCAEFERRFPSLDDPDSTAGVDDGGGGVDDHIGGDDDDGCDGEPAVAHAVTGDDISPGAGAGAGVGRLA
jgi:hypothetical protein